MRFAAPHQPIKPTADLKIGGLEAPGTALGRLWAAKLGGSGRPSWRPEEGPDADPETDRKALNSVVAFFASQERFMLKNGPPKEVPKSRTVNPTNDNILYQFSSNLNAKWASIWEPVFNINQHKSYLWRGPPRIRKRSRFGANF